MSFNLVDLLLLTVFLDSLWLLSFQWLSVVQLIAVCLCVYSIAALGCAFSVEVTLDISALDLLTVHFFQCLLCAFIGFVCHVCKAFGLLCLPVICNSDGFNFAKASESVTDIVLFERIRQSFDKDGLASSWHWFSKLYTINSGVRQNKRILLTLVVWLVWSWLHSLSFFNVKISTTHFLSGHCFSWIIGTSLKESDMSIANTTTWVLECWHFDFSNGE